MKRVLLLVLVLPLAFVALLVCGAIVWLTLATAPPLVSAACLLVMAVLGAWFVFGRRKSAGALTEGSLMGRQTSKEGLL
jgi:hypothetical protein